MPITVINQLPVDLDQASQRTDTQWLVPFQSADVTGGEIIRADPGAGFQLILQWILINYPFAATLSLREDSTIIIGPFTMTSTSPPLIIDMSRFPYPLVANTELQVISDGANIITGVAKGYTTVA